MTKRSTAADVSPTILEPMRDARLDAGFAEIENWHRWFVDAHRRRLEALDLPPAQYQREFAAIEQQAVAIRERMRDDYILRSQPR